MSETNPKVVERLAEDYQRQQALFSAQPAIVQRFLEGQAQIIADALVSKTSQIRFALPDRVVTQIIQVGQNRTITIPEAQRQRFRRQPRHT